MGIEKVCVALSEYFSNNRLLKVLLPLGIPILFVTAGLRFLDNFVSIGSVALAIVFFGFILGLILTLSNSQFQMLAIGLGIWGVDYIWAFLRSAIKYQILNWSALIYIAVYLGLAFLAYKKSMQK